MTDEYTICAAAFFRNKGKSVITEPEFLMVISMDLHWMPYGKAKALLDQLISKNVLVKTGNISNPLSRSPTSRYLWHTGLLILSYHH